ncbi:Uncharacterized protein OBRU01_15848, partial [Operophtera brumata]
MIQVDMESHILNSYHQARYRTIGHKIMRAKSDSLSSEEGHDYDIITVYEVNPDLDLIEASSDDDTTDFSITEKTENDEDGENLNSEESLKYGTSYGKQPTPDNEIDLNLDTPVVSNVDEYFIKEKDILHVDGPVVKDVDEYFIKDKGKAESITVPNVDDFFIKHKLPEEESTKFHIPETIPNADELLVVGNNIKELKPKKFIEKVKEDLIPEEVIPEEVIPEEVIPEEVIPEEVIPEEVIPEEVIPEEVISKKVIPEDVLPDEVKPEEVAPEGDPEGKLDVSINESDLEVLPNIEDLKRYLLEEMTYTKFKSIQRSCSLPHSPMHGSNVCMDVDDAKTCLSFEDLNLDLSDLTFDSDKDKSDNAIKSDDIPRTLTDEDVNSFLITNKPHDKNEKDDDDLNPQEMEIEDTIESNITDIPRVDDSFRKLTSTPLPSVGRTSKVLDFCVEKTPSPSRKELRREKVADLDAHTTPRKVVVEPPRKTKIVPLDYKFNSTKVIDVRHVVPVVKPFVPIVAKPIAVVTKPVVKPVAIKPVAPKSVATKPVNAESKVAPADLDDFVDVESCNDTVIPVLEANNLSSLLEQFEATEKLNKSKKPLRITPTEEQKKNNKSLTNGMRIQDAGVQLKNNKMRQILVFLRSSQRAVSPFLTLLQMPTTINTAVRRSPSPVHSDHDYCSSKKRHSLPNLKGGQSLLKPEVLSSNSRILNSRHRSCKNKKVVYNLSSDDESDKKDTKNKKVISDSELKKKTSVKPAVKPPAQSNCRKKLSPTHSVNDIVLKSNSSVIDKCASKASDTPCSQKSNGSIKLTIKNKSEVILNCDHKDSQIKNNDNVEKFKVSSSVSDVANVVNEIKQEKHIKVEVKPIKEVEKRVKEEEKHMKEVEKNIKEVVRIRNKNVNSVEAEIVSVKKETRPKEEKKDEHFYTALFSNKQDVKLPQSVPIKKELNAFEEELIKANEIKKEEPHKKKKLNLQEYKLRRGVSSNNSSTAVSPESIFPDMPLNSDKTAKPLILTLPNELINKVNNETPQTFYDPIREASRKIVANAKKQKAEALRKRDEDIVMSKIPKVDNLQLQPLISDAEMLKIVGMTQPEPVPAPVTEKPLLPADYDEIILVSVGTNTDDDIFKKLLEAEIKLIEKIKKKNEKSLSPPIDPKSRVNFKINKSETVLKQNVFDLKKDKRHEDKKQAENKIDKERFKDITATLKSVGKQVDTKISSNSLFASIQDVVMKKAPEDQEPEKDRRNSKPRSPVEKREIFKFGRATIVREYDVKADHGEDKIILHLGKTRCKPISASITIQTDPVSENTENKAKTIAKEKSSVNRRRNDSDMSMSSEGSSIRIKEKSKEDKVVKAKTDVRSEKRSLSKEKLSRSKDRYEAKYRRRSRSLSRSRRRRRSPTRSRSRSRGRFRRYRRSDRSDSPYKRKRHTRSRSRSYHKRRSLSRRSPSIRRTKRSRSPSRPRSKSPVAKKARPSPQKVDVKPVKSMTPPLRKPTVSESSDSSTSSSSSSSSSESAASSSSSGSSAKSRRSCTPTKQEPFKKSFRSFSSEDRENNTPVEERRIVFVGKLEKDITKSTLRGQFSKFGQVMEVRLHSKED